MKPAQIVICAPVAKIGGLKFDPHADPRCTYTQVNCPECGQLMWLGARGRAEVQAKRADMLCMVCAVTMGYYTGQMEKLVDRDKTGGKV